MPEPKYICTKILDILDKFIDEYKLTGLDRDGWIYFEIRQGCYGLPQAGILANDLLCSCLKAKGFGLNTRSLAPQMKIHPILPHSR